MKRVRSSAFETNSSSTHSLSIAKGDFTPDARSMTVEDGVCEIFEGEFGWEEEDFCDAATKASYCVTWLKYDQATAAHREMLTNVIKRGTGATEVRFATLGEYGGYIDHQSVEDDGGAGADAFVSEDALYSFIFNPNSQLHTDNDNH